MPLPSPLSSPLVLIVSEELNVNSYLEDMKSSKEEIIVAGRIRDNHANSEFQDSPPDPVAVDRGVTPIGWKLRLGRVFRSATPQQLFDTGGQLRRSKWLGNVIIKTAFKTLFCIRMGHLCCGS